jgi:tRNA pseudouridine38-40 synthase
MATYKLIIAYDGTDFAGFQRQAPGRRTVQATLEQALRDIGWRGLSLRAAGRTDAGVHATGQVVAFELDWDHGIPTLLRALNARLPRDIAVRQGERCQAGFNPRFAAASRSYRYRLLLQPEPDPLVERFAWRLWPAPELGRLERLAQALIGQRDYGAFGRPTHPGGTTVRRVLRAEWRQKQALLEFEIEADAFLYRMVRRLVGMQVAVGLGRRPAAEALDLIGRASRPWLGKPAPPRGLSLEQVRFAPETDVTRLSEDRSGE